MSVPLALYFGCVDRQGHYLHHPDGRSDTDPRRLHPGFPWRIGLLDSGLLRNGRVSDDPDGRVWWTCARGAPLWFAFHWWDRSLDRRPASNSGLYVDGFDADNREAAFAFGCQAWPAVIARQAHPLVLQPAR